MKAIQFSETGAVDVLKYVTNALIPDVKPGMIRVRNHVVGVNFIDTYHRSGLYKVPLPYIPGREAAGVVDAVGEGVTQFKVADRVAYTAPNCCAELNVVSADFAVKLPESVSFEFGASLLLQGLTALSMCKLAYPVKSGDTVLIHAAAGGTGLMLVQICKYLGATVLGTTSSPEKAQIAKKAGADHVILYTQENTVERVMELTGGLGVHAVFDGVGKTTFDTSLACIRKLGTLLSFGNASGKVDDIDIMKLVPRSVKLMRPSLFKLVETKAEFEPLSKELLQMLESKKLDIHIHRVYALEDIAQAHTDLEAKKTTGKLLLQI